MSSTRAASFLFHCDGLEHAHDVGALGLGERRQPVAGLRERRTARWRAGTRCRPRGSSARAPTARRATRCSRARGCCPATGSRRAGRALRARTPCCRAAAPAPRSTGQEPLREHGDVHLPLAQRGQADGECVDAVVEVFAEAAVADELLERPVGRARSAGSRPRSTCGRRAARSAVPRARAAAWPAR